MHGALVSLCRGAGTAHAGDFVAAARSVNLSETVATNGYTCVVSNLDACETNLSRVTTDQDEEADALGTFSKGLTAALGHIDRTSTVSADHADVSGSIRRVSVDEVLWLAMLPIDRSPDCLYIGRIRHGSARSWLEPTFVLDEPGPIELSALVDVTWLGIPGKGPRRPRTPV